MKYDCLIVDDEEALSISTQKYFELFGVKTAWVADEASCLSFFAENESDLILLDINLGNSSGFDLCRRLRETVQIPILFISARTSDDDVLLALGVGGDDYVQKPYSLAVLLAKVKAVLKRYNAAGHEPGTLTSGKLRIDTSAEQAFQGGRELPLKAMEFKLLAYLVRNKGRTVTKEEIFANVWDNGAAGDNTLNVYIRHLREQIEADATNPRTIKTVWGVGYVFSGEVV